MLTRRDAYSKLMKTFVHDQRNTLIYFLFFSQTSLIVPILCELNIIDMIKEKPQSKTGRVQ